MYSSRTLIGAGALSVLLCVTSLFLFTGSVQADDIQPAQAKILAVADQERTAIALDGGLETILNSTSPDQIVSVLVYLAEQENLSAITEEMDNLNATLQLRHETVVRALQEKAGSAQGSIIAYLSDAKDEGKISDFKAFWITNAIRVDATKAEIEKIASRPDVAMIYYNYEIELIEPVDIKDDPDRIITDVEPGVDAVRAPEVWALGITGAGVLVANMDTGVDGNHPALADRWAGVADSRYDGHPEWAWYDPYLGQNDFPYDNGGHGTHTMGSVTGAEPYGDTVGVAPGAYWIASAPIDRGGGIEGTVADAILSFEWMTDPDGNPSTSWDVPAVCSNSWGLTTGHGYPPCDELFWSYLDACEAAGTVILFSAGNESTSGLRRPADRATDAYRTCAVAAVDANNPSWPIASFSSRGPTYCTPDGSMAIKPDIAAPGVDVYSCYPGGGYTTMSGTSMASPHVNGVVALMRQANPNISVQMIKQIIYETAYDLGSAGEDNDYGWGMIDAYEAVMSVMTDRGDVEGYVTDASNSAPLEATIEVVGTMISVQANSSGYYSISLPAGETYTLRASMEFGYFPEEQEVYVIVDETVTLNFELTPWPPPDLSYNPTSFNEITSPGSTLERDLTIYNDGDGPLHYTLWTETDDPALANIGQKNTQPKQRPDPIGYYPASDKAGAVEEPYYPPIITGQGGPDDYGHIWIDSNEPGGPVYNWVDISGVGTPVYLSDDDYTSASIGFTFPFYENDYTSLYICSNGMLTFGSGSTDWTNDPIPSTGTPDNFIAPLWDDLRPPSGGSIYYYYDSVNSRFIVSYEGVPFYYDYGSLTFQVILYPNGKIIFQYNTLIDGGHGLNSASVGIESSGGTDGLEVVYNAGYLEDNLAIDIYGGWLFVTPSSGIIAEHDSYVATVTMDASMLTSGIFNGVIHLDSNDPVNPNASIPVTLTVGAQNPGSILGIVSNEAFQPIENVHVVAIGANVDDYTASDGSYRLDNLVPSTHSVSFSHPDYQDVTETGVVVEPDGETQLDVTMLDLPEEIPTLSEWGMIILALLLLAVGTIAVVRRYGAFAIDK